MGDTFNITSFGAVARGYNAVDMTIVVIDHEKKEFLGSKVIADISDVYIDVMSIVDTRASSGNFTTMMVASWDPAGGDASQLVHSKLIHSVDIMQAEDPDIQHPQRRTTTPLDKAAITIGLGRGYTDQGNGSKMDYAWNQKASNSPKGMIPFVGHVRFPQPIMPLKPGQNFNVNISVANTHGGGGFYEIKPEFMATVYDGFYIDPTDPNVLRWNFAPGKTTSDAGSPILFERIKWPADMHATFFFKALVFLEPGIPAITSVRSAPVPPVNPPDGHTPIMPINFTWHCVSWDTKVRMADGNQKPIQDIKAGDKIWQSGSDQGAVDVLWTQIGHHHGLVCQVFLANGATLTCTDDHVLVGEFGPVMAKELDIGDAIYVAASGGCDDLDLIPVQQLMTIDGFDGVMCNLGLSQIDHNHPTSGVFFANEICVGDCNATDALKAKRKNDITYLKSISPTINHIDLQSYFEDFADIN